MAINRENYQAELAARKSSRSRHLSLQSSLLQLPGRRLQVNQRETSAGVMITLRVIAGLVVLTGLYFILF